MFSNLIKRNWIKNIRDRIQKKKLEQEEYQMFESIQRAREEWMDKENFFNFATDPDLIDFAIYDIEASRRKYAYLLKQAREENKKS